MVPGHWLFRSIMQSEVRLSARLRSAVKRVEAAATVISDGSARQPQPKQADH